MSVIEYITANRSSRNIVVGGMVALAIFVGLAAAYLIFLHKPYAVLFSNLRTPDAATVVADLDKKKIPYRLQDGGATILVPAEHVDATRLSVLSGDIPLKGVVGFELFNKSDMGLTEFAQKINYQRALQGELARTIMAIEGVDSARVHLSMPEPSIFRDDRRPPKASVALIMRAGANLSSPVVLGIQRLVAAAVPDLEPANVVVIDDKGRIVSTSVASTASASGEGEQQRAIEEYYAGKVRQALEKALSKNDFDVAITVQESAAGDSGFEDWAPNDRKFPLKVEITSSAPLNAKLQEDIQAVAGEVIGFDAGRGDAISVTQGAPQAGAADEPGLKPVQAGAPDEASVTRKSGDLLSPTNFWLVVLAPTLAVLGVGALLLARRGYGPRRLSDAERQAYARRLTQLVGAEDPDVVHRL